jgi:phosphoheptose isomerase/glycosyltransferase involved in cell wall biosynthesis
MKRIAMISEHASPLAILGGVDSGGQNVYVGQLARHVAALGYEVDVFTRRDSAGLPEVAEWARGVRIVHVPAGPAEWVRKEDLLPHMGEFTAGMIHFCRRQRSRYALAHANFWMSGLVAADLRQALGLPFVVTFHALGRVRRAFQRAADAFPDARFAVEDRIVAEADHIVAECPQEEEDLIRYYNADPARTTIVPGGFDPAEFWPIAKPLARVTLGLPLHEPIVLQLGRLVPRKGVDTAIRGLARLRDEHGIAARLLIVGGDANDPDSRVTPEIGRLQAVAREEGVEDAVVFVGRRGRDVLKHYYSAADVFVTTPWYEPFGITPLEAMACGTPVIGANVGGIKFTVRDGETGYLVPPDDAAAVGERIAHLYRHPRLLTVFGRQAIRRANDLFTWRHVAGGVAAIYEDVLAAGDPRRRAQAGHLAVVDHGFDETFQALHESKRRLRGPIAEAADVVAECVTAGGTVLVCGHGGSAAQAQYLAGELVGRFRLSEHHARPVVALTADSTVVTAWANDAGDDDVFARQVEALGRTGDVLVALSTSGRSPSVLRALQAARRQGVRAIGLLGRDGGRAQPLVDVAITVPVQDTQRIREIHLVAVHLLCELVERRVAGDASGGAAEESRWGRPGLRASRVRAA